ncbi:MAG: hypothetical protein KF861_16560 [Planctomycetaceae bacterium]|nr:hypothetical protein [Planctomycetaceae bacterium]
MNNRKKALIALVLAPLLAFIVLEGISLRSIQRVETKRREVVAAGGKTKTEQRVPAWLGRLRGDDFHTFLDETALTEITMSGADITDENVKHLQGLTDLRVLDVSQSQISDAGLQVLSGLTDLRFVNLFKTPVTTLTPLEPLHQLETLVIEHTEITDDALASLEHFPNLTELNAGYLELTDTGIEHIARCSKLETLGLSGTNLTDRGCELISQLTGLTTLVLRNAEPSPEGLRAFQQAVPACNVIR